jgi:hypothetical protein
MKKLSDDPEEIVKPVEIKKNQVTILWNPMSSENFLGQFFIHEIWIKFHPKITDKPQKLFYFMAYTYIKQ